MKKMGRFRIVFFVTIIAIGALAFSVRESFNDIVSAFMGILMVGLAIVIAGEIVLARKSERDRLKGFEMVSWDLFMTGLIGAVILAFAQFAMHFFTFVTSISGVGDVLVSFAVLLFDIIKYITLFIVLLVVGSIIFLAVSRKKDVQTKIDIGSLRKGDVILVGSNERFHAWYIQASNILTNGMYSKIWTHSALHIDNGKIIEAVCSGLVYSTVEDYIKKGRPIKVYRHRYIPDSDNALNKMVDFCEESKEEDYRYGWIALAFFTFASFLPVTANFVFNNKFVDKLCYLDKGYFCSELVADAYQHAGYKVSSADSWRTKPSDFMKNPIFEEITF